MFNNFSLSDEEVFYIINKYQPLIKKESKIHHRFDNDLNQEIKIRIYSVLTKNRKK